METPFQSNNHIKLSILIITKNTQKANTFYHFLLIFIVFYKEQICSLQFMVNPHRR